MRRLAILVVCACVSLGLAASAAAAPLAEEELLLDEPQTDLPTQSIGKVAPPARSSEKNAPGQIAAHKKPLSRKAGRAMASTHRGLVTKARPLPVSSSAAPSFYVGVHFGGGWTHFNPPIDAKSVNGSGVIGGGQFGANYQIDKLVFGVEADMSASNVRGHVSGDLGGTPVTGSVHNNWFATLGGRMGVTTAGALAYLKAGGAWTRYTWDFAAQAGGTATAAETRSGWMVGTGVECPVSSAESVKIEYNYLAFGHRTETLATTGGLAALSTAVRLDVHLLKVGLNHRFVTN